MSQPWDPEANAILSRAIEIDSPENRAAYLEEACGGDPELRQRVDRLLGAHQEAGSFLQGGPDVTKETSRPSESLIEDVGTQIGPYKLLQQIGEGGFGVVYMAEQTRPVNRMVALKIIKPGMDTREVIARFEAERQALALMDHPNIARVLDGGATGSGRPYFVMELVKGIPLTDFCDQSKLSTRERLELFATVCRAVQHAHQKGVIHRDLKPSNVMVTLHDGQPVPKVIDFGVSKAISQKLTEKTMFTAYGQMIGTPQYMSPEQAEMSGLDIDTRSDIYSLGVLLYELLTGTTPLEAKQFRGQMFAELQRLIREEEAPRPSTRVSTLGEATAAVAARRGTDAKKLGALLRGELDWIVMKALEKDRSRRYETANSFASDVQRYLNDDPVVACPPTAGYRLRKLVRRHKTAMATSAVVAVALIAGTIVSTWQAIRATSAESKANDNAVLAQEKADEAAREAKRATASEAELRKSQQELQERLYASDMRLASQAYTDGAIGHMNELLAKHDPAPNAGEPPSFEWHHLWRAGHSYDAWIRHPFGLFRRMAISPDRKTLAVVGTPGWIFLYDTATKIQVSPPLRGDSEYDTPCFSPDGKYLVVAGRHSPQTYVFTTDTWHRTTLDSGKAHALAFGRAEDESLMATGGPDTLTIWSLLPPSAQQGWRWERQDELPVRGTVLHLAFAPEDKQVIAVMESGAIEVWNLDTRKVTRRLEGSWGTVAVSSDGRRFAIEQKGNRTVGVWDSIDFFADEFIGDNRLKTPNATLWVPPPGWITSLAFSPDGSRLVAGMNTRKVFVWDAESGNRLLLRRSNRQPLANIRGHSRPVWGVSFDKDAKAVWSSGGDGYLKVWNVDGCLPYDTWPRMGSKSESGKTGVDASSPIGYVDSNTLLFLDKEGLIQQWSVKNGALGEPIDEDHKYRGMAMSDDGARLAGVTRENELLVWDLTGTRPSLSSASRLERQGTGRMAVSRDGSRVAFVGNRQYDGDQVSLVDAESGKQIGQTMGNLSEYGWPTFSPRPDHQLVLRRWMMPLYHTEVWDVSNEAFSREFAVGGSPDHCAAFTRDGKILALGNYTHEIRLYHGDTGELIQVLPGHNNEVLGLAFTQDGRRLISTGGDNTLRIWTMGNAPNGQWRLVTTLRVRSKIETIAVAPDGSSVAAARADGVLQVWRTATAEQVNRNKEDRQLVQEHDELKARVASFLLNDKADPIEIEAVLRGAFLKDPDGALKRRFVAEYMARQFMKQSPRGWEAMAACYNVLVELKPNDPQAWLRAATLAVYTGDLDRYDQLCSEMLEQFREADDGSVGDKIAKACCLIGTPGQSELAAIHAIADKALGVDENRWGGMYRPFAQTAKALAEYRSGNDAAAVETAKDCLKRTEDVPAWFEAITPGVPSVRIASAVSAMAHWRSGDRELAIKELNEFEQSFLRNNSPLHTGESFDRWNYPFAQSWIDWLICDILLREAEQEISGPAPSE